MLFSPYQSTDRPSCSNLSFTHDAPQLLSYSKKQKYTETVCKQETFPESWFDRNDLADFSQKDFSLVDMAYKKF